MKAKKSKIPKKKLIAAAKRAFKKLNQKKLGRISQKDLEKKIRNLVKKVYK